MARAQIFNDTAADKHHKETTGNLLPTANMASRRTVQLVAGTRQPRLYFLERHEVCCLRRHNHPSLSNSSSRPFSSSAPFAYPQGAQASQKRLGGNASPRSFAVMQKEVQKQLMDSGRVFEEYGVLPGEHCCASSEKRLTMSRHICHTTVLRTTARVEGPMGVGTGAAQGALLGGLPVSRLFVRRKR